MYLVEFAALCEENPTTLAETSGIDLSDEGDDSAEALAILIEQNLSQALVEEFARVSVVFVVMTAWPPTQL